MLLTKIVELFQRLPSGGILTDENKLDPDFIEDAVHRARASAIFIYWQRTKRINALWTQQFIAQFDEDIQENNCLVKFEVPPVVSLDNKMDGFLYIGTVDKDCAFRKVESRAQLANANLHRITKVSNRINKALYSDGFMEIHGNTMLKELKVDGIFINPTDIPTFNKEFDEYPVSLDLVNQMETIIANIETPQIEKEPIDVISDSADTTSSIQRPVTQR